MRRLLALVTLLALLPACGAIEARDGTDGDTPLGHGVLVTRVVDGDTAEVMLDGREVDVRLIGIDTPESVAPDQPIECFGEEASAYTESRIEGRTVRLEEAAPDHPVVLSHRSLHACDELFNETLVSGGYALATTYPPNVKYVDRFVAAQRAAREAGRGLWGGCPE